MVQNSETTQQQSMSTKNSNLNTKMPIKQTTPLTNQLKVDKKATVSSGKTSTSRPLASGSAGKSREVMGGFSSKLNPTKQSSAIFKTSKKKLVSETTPSNGGPPFHHQSQLQFTTVASDTRNTKQLHALPKSSSFKSPSMLPSFPSSGGTVVVSQSRQPGVEDRPGVPHKTHHKSQSTAKMPRNSIEKQPSSLYMTTNVMPRQQLQQAN